MYFKNMKEKHEPVPNKLEPPNSDRLLHPDNQIQQDATGDRNQVIGQVSDSTIVNFAGERQVINLTIHDRVPQSSVPPPVVTAQMFSQQEYRQRKVLLNRVKEYWVKGVLEKSLHSTTLIELGLEERTDALQYPFQEVMTDTSVPRQALPDGTNATIVFNRMEAGRTLLILGEPGSGKTIMLLKLTQDLIARSEEDLSQPIPVVFNLSSWGKKQLSIAEWLVQESIEKYQVSRTLAQTWVEEQQLILLLDGLDEVKAEYREVCVRALNQFTQTYGLTEIAVCCRIQDYQALSGRLTLRSAICIQPLTHAQIEQYLNCSGEQLATLQTVLQQDEELRELATSPLILSVMSLAYQNCSLDAFPKPGTTEELYKQLFNDYIERMLQRRGAGLIYSKGKTLRWLNWLAKRMTQENQTVFLIELMQPYWLGSKWRKTIYHLLSGLIVGVTTALLFTPTLGGIIEFFMKLWGSQPLSMDSNITLGIVMVIGGISIGLMWGFGFAVLGERIENSVGKLFAGGIGGVILSLITVSQSGGINSIYSLIMSLVFSALVVLAIWSWLSFFFSVHIKPVEILKWSWSNAKAKSISGALWGLLMGLIFGILVGVIDYARFRYAYSIYESLDSSQPEVKSIVEWIRTFSTPVILGLVNGLGFSIIFEVLGGLIGGLIGGLSGATVETRAIPNQGMWQSAKNAVILGLLGAVCLSIAFSLIGLPWSSGVFLGVLVGISGAGIACIQHVILRSLLYINGFAPWNYARFLNYATSCVLLQKVGGGYIFIHRLLLEHFAAINSV
jgi:GTPase SAR1 family protein